MKLSDLIFQDANKAREWFEAQRWPNGPICPHCGNSDQDKISPLKGEAHRPGLFKCYNPKCRKQFSVQVGTVMERSHVALNVWASVMFLMASSKKNISARQVARMTEVPLKTVWFLTHRIREAMKDDNAGPLGGQGKVVESDETVFGGKAKNRAYAKPPKKSMVMTLVEREGKVRSFHIANVTAKTNSKAVLDTPLNGALWARLAGRRAPCFPTPWNSAGIQNLRCNRFEVCVHSRACFQHQLLTLSSVAFHRSLFRHGRFACLQASKSRTREVTPFRV